MTSRAVTKTHSPPFFSTESSGCAAAGLGTGVVVGVVEGHGLGGVHEVVFNRRSAHPTLLHRRPNALLVFLPIVLIQLSGLTDGGKRRRRRVELRWRGGVWGCAEEGIGKWIRVGRERVMKGWRNGEEGMRKRVI